MIKKIKVFIAVAALSGTVGANVQAAELTVQTGDTLWDLSQVHNTTVENIQTWNHLSTDLIHPGDVLEIATEKQYTVKQDDTLWDVAVKFQVTVKQIKEWNQLNTDLIHPGLNLVVYDQLSDDGKNSHTETLFQNSNTLRNNSVSVQRTSRSVTAKDARKEITSPAKKEVSSSVISPSKSKDDRTKEITVKATAYTASCEGCSGTTATGVDLNANPDAKVIAVDPSVIPLGSKVYVEGYGVATAADTGGAIKGNRIDVFIPSKQDAINWGKKHIKIRILNQ
ncbi:LysM peptidoglycan-binding domain-containing protein [Neobacillus sp.]|uniref:LysM peptidoglycan-binding and 3D domain-containing protein n=1 Tax=Neobacillus sp. TaxID=2675273 RepID=UPI00289E1186|nr:LysM peptidoglycan-binding domain-containing protein [Neobacillus sp.]